MADRSFIGKGQLYVREYGSTAARLPVGNASALKLSHEQEKKELQDFTAAGGGLANSLTRITKVNIEIDVRDFSPTNVARAVYGAATEVTAGTATDEEVTLHVGGLGVLAKTATSITSVKSKDGNTASAWADTTAYTLGQYRKPTVSNGHYYKCTVAGTSGGTEPTWPTDGSTVVDGTATWTDMGLITRPTTDYERSNSGMIRVPSASTIDDGRPYLISYGYGAQDVVQALINSGLEFEAVFDGLNEAQSDDAVVLIAHRLKFSPTDALDLIADDFGTLKLTGELLSDAVQSGAGVSKFYKVIMAQ